MTTVQTQTWLLVAVAGAVGTLLRYGLGGWIARTTGGPFPLYTFLINAVGCLAIGIVSGAVERGAILSPQHRTALAVGLIGGFTTYSTFALDAFRLASARQWTVAAAYVVATNVVGLAAVWAGYKVAA